MTGPRSKLPMQRPSPLAAATLGALLAHVERPRPSNDNPGWLEDWAWFHEQETLTMVNEQSTAQTAIPLSDDVWVERGTAPDGRPAWFQKRRMLDGSEEIIAVVLA